MYLKKQKKISLIWLIFSYIVICQLFLSYSLFTYKPIVDSSPVIHTVKVKYIYLGDFKISAYNSVPEQTDDSPCISADGKDICDRFKNGEKLCASNDFKLGVTIYIEGYGNCKIVDRMNVKYSNSIDIFFGYDVQKAKEFGVKKSEVYKIK